MHFVNKFFTKIFVISLFDNITRWTKVSQQFKRRDIKIERFIAVDGRCKTQGKKGCEDKLKSFEMAYNVKISNKSKMPLKVLVPASSLTIGTIIILREMVKKKWKHVLICEDDVEIKRNFEEKLKQGIYEIGNTKWDILYLGCGNMCGNEGVSYEKTSRNKYESIFDDYIYNNDERDLRRPCDYCYNFSDHLSWAEKPGGTWAYAYSLKGAKKMLKLINDDAGEHIDQLLSKFTSKGKLRSLAFDPPIIMHELLDRDKSDIPW